MYLVIGHGCVKGRKDETILSPFSLRIPEGSLVMINGESGAGKSVFMHTVAGRCVPGMLDGAEVDAIFMKQDPRYAYLGSHRASDIVDRTRCPSLFHILRIDSYADKLMRELSGGQCQRVVLYYYLVCRTDVPLILLDEPFAALPREMARGICQFMRDTIGNRVIMISSHDLSLNEFADSVITVKSTDVSMMQYKSLLDTKCDDDAHHPLMRSTTPFVHHLRHYAISLWRTERLVSMMSCLLVFVYMCVLLYFETATRKESAFEYIRQIHASNLMVIMVKDATVDVIFDLIRIHRIRMNDGVQTAIDTFALHTLLNVCLVTVMVVAHGLVDCCLFEHNVRLWAAHAMNYMIDIEFFGSVVAFVPITVPTHVSFHLINVYNIGNMITSGSLIPTKWIPSFISRGDVLGLHSKSDLIKSVFEKDEDLYAILKVRVFLLSAIVLFRLWSTRLHSRSSLLWRFFVTGG